MGRLRQLKHLVLGDPLATSEASHERLTRPKALAVLSSDALSSVAYATEESLVTLSAAGVAAFAANIPIALAIVALLVIVTVSYRQTIFAYPNGGGAYTVAADNLGRNFGLVAAAALLIDYVLTVSVSVSSGVAALTSALPAMAAWNVEVGVACIVIITLVNLRGIRDSANIFAVPTFLFIGSILTMLVIGAFKLLFGSPVAAAVVNPPAAVEGLGLFLILKTFASGCSAMTGVEAISNGVPAFKAPESKHAAQTMLVMSGLLTTMFLGITFLSHAYHLAPNPQDTILSQLAKSTIGAGW
ncbi:MAG: APC family permease, partial [Deltaproteobacteria bacterium]|nr:APC family permease [Deltaproteobacteria bacterium]